MKSIYCSVEDCNRDVFCRTYCKAHYGRLRTYGDVRAHIPLRKLPTAAERGDIERRILQRCAINAETGCIEWTGFTLQSGYGTISWDGREWVVHRAMWTVKVGPIPTDDDWTLDHLCFNRRCVNIRHLEVVTRTENSRRGGGLLRAQSLNKARNAKECRNGHRRTAENTRIDSRGYQECVDCQRETWRRKADEVNAERRAKYAKRRADGIPWQQARLAG